MVRTEFTTFWKLAYVISLSSRSITCLPGNPPKLCAPWTENSQNFWVGGMPPGYSKGSWCDLRVPEKMMFGRTNNVGFDPFSRYSRLHKAPGRPVTAGYGWPLAGRGRLQPAAWPVTAGCGWPLAGHGRLWLAAGHSLPAVAGRARLWPAVAGRVQLLVGRV